MRSAVIGLDIGGTKIAAHISDGSAWSVHPLTRPTPQGPHNLLQALIELCQTLQRRAHADHITLQAVGIGSAGQIDSQRGVVLDANENIPGWQGVAIAQPLRQALGLPVFVDNDVRVMALAESALGAGRAYRHLLCITVGTGIGGAIVIDGQVWHGAHFLAGEIGYLRAATGLSIEESYAGPAIERRYAQIQGEALDLRQIAERARRGDSAAQDILQRAASDLGEHLAPALTLLDPEALIVGGGVPESGPLWWEAFTGAIGRFRLASVRSLPILRAQWGAQAGMLGAALLAQRRLVSEV